jgi:TonB family protein
VVVWSHINLARIFEITGQRDRAIGEYRAAVGTNDNTGGALDEAIKFLKETGDTVPAVNPEAKTAVFIHPPPGVYPIGPDVFPPVPMVDNDSPAFTEEARLAELEGTVWVAAVVGADGTARNMQVTHGIGLGLDEKAVETIRKWRFWPGLYHGKEVDTLTTIPIDFLLSSKQSRWHLVQTTFRPPDGVSRPMFRSVSYPPGAGVSRQLVDHGRVIVAIGRQATATLSFDVNPDGRPVQFKVESASDEHWGPEAIALVQNWQFAPGMKDGEPMSVPCTVTLVWGKRTWTCKRFEVSRSSVLFLRLPATPQVGLGTGTER